MISTIKNIEYIKAVFPCSLFQTQEFMWLGFIL